MATYDREGVISMLPQQPPFLFVDSAEVCDDGVTGKYKITGEEVFISGHFKHEPVFPASIIFEALGQAACLWVLERAPQATGKIIHNGQVFFASMDGANVYRKMRPGDELIFDVKLYRLRDPLAVFSGTVSTPQGERVAKIDRLMLAFGDQILPSEPASAR